MTRTKRANIEDQTVYVPPEGLEEMKNMGCPHGRSYCKTMKPGVNDPAEWWLEHDCATCAFSKKDKKVSWRMYCTREKKHRQLNPAGGKRTACCEYIPKAGAQ